MVRNITEKGLKVNVMLSMRIIRSINDENDILFPGYSYLEIKEWDDEIKDVLGC